MLPSLLFSLQTMFPFVTFFFFQDNVSSEKKEVHDQTNKVSFITKAPPLPLDTYVNVEGYHNNSKKKMAKQHSSQNIITEDILKGIVYRWSFKDIVRLLLIFLFILFHLVLSIQHELANYLKGENFVGENFVREDFVIFSTTFSPLGYISQ